jgi:hypothetical protein
MALGNEWEFSSNIDPHSEMIVDTLRKKETLYFGFSRSLSEPEYWLREYDNRVYYFNLIDSTEFLLFDFTIDIGDSIELPLGYECSFGRKIFLVGKTDTIITPSGTFYNCYHFQHLTYCADAGIYDSWFTKGIGKVKYVAEYFAGIAEFLLNSYSIVTLVDEKSDNNIIHSYKLFQNFPNPFNPVTKIKYSIPEDDFVALNIYDILGNELKTLLNDYKQAGTYETEFNASNLPSGVYFYRIISGNFLETRKMLLLK